jgi:nicotinamidase/pyrazinamidase
LAQIALTPLDALIVVDVQNDFMPWGALPVPGADGIIPTVNRLAELFRSGGNPVFATRDWHPENHVSFKENGGLWPRHCIQWSWGADFPDSLKLPPETFIINKGDRPELEAYSGFQGTLLRELLLERGVKRVFVCGVATDYCVKNTALGALNLGFATFVITDAVKGVAPETSERALKTLLLAGAVLIESQEIALL